MSVLARMFSQVRSGAPIEHVSFKRQTDAAPLTAMRRDSGSMRKMPELLPYTVAMEQISQGDEFLSSHNWLHAREHYTEAALKLERLHLADPSRLQHCLRNLSYAQLRLFDFAGAFVTFIRSGRAQNRHPNESLLAESEALMQRIKSARGADIGRDDDYTPRFFTGHL